MTTTTLTLTPSAARQITKIIADATHKALGLRLEVLGGGCSGFQYKFQLADSHAPDDIIIERDGAKLLIDPTSLDTIKGSEIDFGESLMEAGFKVNNPQAVSSCGCGNSFALKDS